MASYHFNPDTGLTGVCKAKIKCDFDLAEDQHFATAAEASAAYEATQDTFANATESRSQLRPKFTIESLPMTSTESITETKNMFSDFRLDDYADQIEIPNSNAETSREREFVTLAEIKDNPTLGAGNCYGVSNALENELKPDFMLSKIDFYTSTINYDDGFSHTFNQATLPNGEIVVVDYTANQYDKELPVPYVASPKEWAQTINDRVKKTFNTQISSESLKNLAS